MSKTAALEEHWEIKDTRFSLVSAAVHIKSRTRDEHRIAYRVPGATRWKLSAALSETFADDALVEVQRDFRRSHYDMRSMRHMLNIYARQIMPTRLAKHRSKMEKRKEARALSNLTQFGIF